MKILIFDTRADVQDDFKISTKLLTTFDTVIIVNRKRRSFKVLKSRIKELKLGVSTDFISLIKMLNTPGCAPSYYIENTFFNRFRFAITISLFNLKKRIIKLCSPLH